MIDWTKPIETMDGTPGRYLGSYLRDGAQWHIVVVLCDANNETPWIVTDDGRKCALGPTAVRNVPEKHERWLNFDGKHLGGIWRSRPDADAQADNRRTACIRVEWQDGEGLT